MRDLHVIVSNKVATYLSRDGNIVCGNSDYQIVFTFDSEWDAHNEKVARFIWNDKYLDVEFSGDTVAVPVLSGTKQLKVGVYAGNLCTTTPAVIECQFSILCETGASGEYIPPIPQNKVAAIAITEATDGTVTMVNTLTDGGTETIVVGADANGNPNKLTVNGKEIPISWAVSE